VFDSEEVLEKKLATSVSKQLNIALKEKNKACLAVSGGKTPVLFFKELSQQELDWAKVTVILVDERWLATDHKDSNEKLVRDNLIKNKAKQAYFLGLKNNADRPSEGIMDCETQLRTQVEELDVVVLGMGLDGHTASWFSGSEQLPALLDTDTAAWCLPIEDEFLPQPRMSLTWRFIKRASKIYLHFSNNKNGNDKADDKNGIFEKASEGISEQLPVSHILHQDGISISV
jgi:6-phosphogluconolactonase